MDPPSPLQAVQRRLQQKNARLNARRRLLFKRQHMHGNDDVAHCSRLLAWEARQVRSSLMRLQMGTDTPLLQKGCVHAKDVDSQPHGSSG